MILQRVKDGFGRRVKVAVDVNERALFGMFLDEFGQSFVEPAFNEPNVFVDLRQTAFAIERPFAETFAPIFGQAFKTVEAVKNRVGLDGGKKIDTVALEDAELQE